MNFLNRLYAAVLAFAAVLLPFAHADTKPAIVFVSAHPDDTEGFAGTAFLLRDDYDLHVVDLTRGESGLGQKGLEDGSTAKIRVQEEERACAFLGAKAHFLDEVDGPNCHASKEAAEGLAAVLRAVKPVAVFTHWPLDTHPDHVQAAAVTAWARQKVGKELKRTLELYFYEVLVSQTMQFPPLYRIDISSVMDKKLEMLRMYACQNENDSLAQEKERQGAARGAEMHPPVAYAECFTTLDGKLCRKGVLSKLVARLANGRSLESAFADPPRAAAPHVWWHWMNGNVSKAGITADLAAMAEIGLAGAQMFDCGCGMPVGDVAFASPEWNEMVLHAHNEAKRLGLQLCVANCSGYSSSGGPWIPVEDSMKTLAWTETRVTGPAADVALPPLPDPHGYARDIAVIAFPTPKGLSVATADVTPSVATNKASLTFTYALPAPRAFDEIRYAFPATRILWGDAGEVSVTVEVPDRRGAWKTISSLTDNVTPGYYISDASRFARLPRTSAAAVRVTFGFKSAASLRTARTCDVALGSFGRIDQLGAKTLNAAVRVKPSTPPRDDIADFTVRSADAVTLIGKIGADGRLDWAVPSGDWTLLRLGYAASGRICAPASAKGEGLEVDKLDAAALGRHFDAYVGRLVKLCGIDPASDPYTRAGLVATLVDSYEVGSQNWTDGFDKTFWERCGYSLFKYLPALTGYVVDSISETDGFLFDFRRTVADAFAENYADALAKKCEEAGILLTLEPYGSAPCDNLRYARRVHLPMSEFWARTPDEVDPQNVHIVASSAHLRGRRYVGAEAFTTFAENAGWRQDPWSYKAQGDVVYCGGVNRIVYHRFAHQPWTEPTRYPGMTMGYWGTHFERTQTWWKMAGDWIRYQTRCQWMLQEGAYAADFLCYAGSDAPVDGQVKRPPRGYAFDVCGRDSLADLRVVQGLLVAPGGTTYRFLTRPKEVIVRPAEDREFARLAAAGATVVFDDDTEKVVEGLQPDFESFDESARLNWIHRRYGGNVDAYFVATPCTNSATVECAFRLTGKAPELWDPETGRIVRATDWRVQDGRTFVKLSLGPCGSTFVVFRTPDATGAAAPQQERELASLPVTGDWTVSFPPGWGAPASVALPALASLSTHADAGVRYFSGTMTYAKELTLDPSLVAKADRVTIDLGAVANLARVTANGVPSPTVCWKPPYVCDITEGAKKGEGRVKLEVEVANLWINRLVGDEVQCAPDGVWKGRRRDALIREIPDFVKKGEPSPTGRHTFTTCHFWLKSDAANLPPSGLLGPVTVKLEKIKLVRQ